MPTHICGAGLGFLGFAVSLIIGLYVNNSFTTVVLRALAVLGVFYVLGVALAALAQRAVQENFENEIATGRAKERTTGLAAMAESMTDESSEGEVAEDLAAS